MQDFMLRVATVMHPDLLFIIAAAGAFAFVVVHLAEKLFWWAFAAMGRAFWRRYHRPSDPACTNYVTSWPKWIWMNDAHRGKSCMICMHTTLRRFPRADLELWQMPAQPPRGKQ